MTTATHPHSPAHPHRNETTADRVVRVVVGLAGAVAGVILLTSAGSSAAYAWESILTLVGLVLLVTGVAGYCPLYAAVGFVPKSLRDRD
ncbi:MAG TPA: DUF2892 domain-containing protein [Acidimicrobiales bacterium]|nr:MAG: hypothetical protein B7Z69_09205 [Actinobacteria bacterium 21-73-9]HQU27204.1 DUF2892 domain-containing protein [Acidimicrobiales bacterium]